MTAYWDTTLGTFPGVPEMGQAVDYYAVVGIPCEPRRGIVAEPYVGGRFVIEFPNGDRTITWPGSLALPGHPIR